MGTSSSKTPPQQLNEFRKLNTATQEVEIPAPSNTRTLTDRKGFIIFGIMLVVFLPFFIYTLAKSDIRRLDHGYDNCGNLCGIDNSKIDGISCSGKDYTKLPYERRNILKNITYCTDKCPPGYVNKQGTCDNPDSDDGDDSMTISKESIWKSIDNAYWKFLVVIIITTALCLGMLLLFKFVPEVVVWGILIISILLVIIATCLLWYGYSQTDQEESTRSAYLYCAIILTIFDIIIIALVIFLIKKIRLMIVLYKETAKAIFAMPLLLLLPIITVFIQLCILALLMLTTTWMATSANLVETSKNNYEYVQNGAMTFAMVFNVVMVIWSLYFFTGCQYMISAGSVASWFFTRNNRLYLTSPIFTSFINTIRYHLGTIALGSFILMLVAVIKALIKSLIRNSKIRWIVDCCMGNVEAILKFLSKNAYIETAIHGQSFFRSGRRAAQLLIQNASSVIALNSVGDFVLGMAQLLLLGVSTGIAYGIFSNHSDAWFPTVLCLIMNFFIVIVFFSVFETTVDTLFICFCEDMVLNDGMSKPYCMSKNLMQFVENSKKIYTK